MDIDFSLNNPKIKSFFNGDDSYMPTSELLYLHTRPLIRPNFIEDINMLIDLAGEALINKKIPANSITVISLMDLGIRLGRELGTLQIINPEEVLNILRELYTLSNTIIKG